jgi:hypothetical protein
MSCVFCCGQLRNASHRACEHIERGICSRLQRRSGEIEALAAEHQQKKIGMCPCEAEIAASDCFQLREDPHERGTKPVIPNRCNREEPFSFSKRLYKLR